VPISSRPQNVSKLFLKRNVNGFLERFQQAKQP
jgi:hypothetical protein